MKKHLISYSPLLRSVFLVLLGVLVLFSSAIPVYAISDEQRRLYDSGVDYFDLEVAAASSCGSSTLTGSTNEEKAWNYLIGKGLTVIQTAGAMGNLKTEGNFNPSSVEGGGMSGGRWVYTVPHQFPREMDTIPPSIGPAGQPGYGIVGWTSPGRKQGLQTMADEKGLPVNDLGLQLDFMWSELEGPYRASTLDPLRATNDLAEATRIWQERYEVGMGFQPRYTHAQELLTAYGSNTTPPTGSGSSASSVCGLPSGDVSELARQILASSNVQITSSRSQIENVAAGKGPCDEINTEYTINPELLRLLVAVSQTNSFTITSLHRGCSGSIGTFASTSMHNRGDAVDISGAINGVPMGTSFGFYDGSGSVQRLINNIATLLPENCGLGLPNDTYINQARQHATNCSRLFLDTPGTTGATGPHIHVGISRQ